MSILDFVQLCALGCLRYHTWAVHAVGDAKRWEGHLPRTESRRRVKCLMTSLDSRAGQVQVEDNYKPTTRECWAHELQVWQRPKLNPSIAICVI